jgi:mono/diheme cytochrome c family protein
LHKHIFFLAGGLGRRIALATGLAAFAAASLAQLPPPAECPQPRFTGKAPDEYYTRKNPLPANADVRAAEGVFQEKGGKLACATCHGAKGDGRGSMSGQFDPHPRNFRCAATVNGIPDGQLFWIIRYGSPGTAMPPHANLTDEQVWQLVLYLRRLAN